MRYMRLFKKLKLFSGNLKKSSEMAKCTKQGIEQYEAC